MAKSKSELMLDRIFRVAELLASSESAYKMLDTSKKHPKMDAEKCEKLSKENSNS